MTVSAADGADRRLKLTDRYFLSPSSPSGPSPGHLRARRDRRSRRVPLRGRKGSHRAWCPPSCSDARRAREVIVADYAATQENLDAIIDRLMSTEGYQTMLSALPPDTLHAEPETMLAFLERMHGTYGSMEVYASSAGVSAEAIARLRERLLTDEPVEAA